MATVEITFERALRIWWSYTWRTIVLLAPIVILMLYVLPAAPVAGPEGAAPAASADPMAESQVNPLLLIVILVVNIAMQVQALRWMLKTKWRDFRLQAVSNEGGSNP